MAIDNITGATVTATAHGFSTGDWVYIGARFHKITVTGANTFTTADFWGSASAADGPTCARVYRWPAHTTRADLSNSARAGRGRADDHTPSPRCTRTLAPGCDELGTDRCRLRPPTGAPSSVLVTPTSPASGVNTIIPNVVTAVRADGVTESLPSAVASASNDLTGQGGYNTVSWSGVAGAVRYSVTKLRGGVYGYIGQIIPDTTLSTVICVDFPRLLIHDQRRRPVRTESRMRPTSASTSPTQACQSLDGTWWLTAVHRHPFYAALPLRGMPASASTGKITGCLELFRVVRRDDNVLPDPQRRRHQTT